MKKPFHVPSHLSVGSLSGMDYALLSVDPGYPFGGLQINKYIQCFTYKQQCNEENDCVSHSLQDPSHKKVALTFHVCRVKLMVL